MGIQEEIVNTILKVNMRTVLLDIMLMRSEFHFKKKIGSGRVVQEDLKLLIPPCLKSRTRYVKFHIC